MEHLCEHGAAIVMAKALMVNLRNTQKLGAPDSFQKVNGDFFFVSLAFFVIFQLKPGIKHSGTPAESGQQGERRIHDLPEGG